MIVFKYINKTILPIAAGVTIGLTVMAVGNVISTTMGSFISGSFSSMFGFIVGDMMAIGTSLCAITGLCYLSYKQNHNEVISDGNEIVNIKVSEIIESHTHDEVKDCEVIIQGEVFENVDFN